ncbi:unnamed protein product [Citrullus colocynthis]|uniref:Uncharacterized protein n=1 Tax=Citrullus colocynthis TaxID=252529 RepID=A0ABP0XMS6_9ROSI
MESINGVIDDGDELNVFAAKEEEDSYVIPHVHTGVPNIPSDRSIDMQFEIPREKNIAASEEAKNVVLSDIDPDFSGQKSAKAFSSANVSNEDSDDNSRASFKKVGES